MSNHLCTLILGGSQKLASPFMLRYQMSCAKVQRTLSVGLISLLHLNLLLLLQKNSIKTLDLLLTQMFELIQEEKIYTRINDFLHLHESILTCSQYPHFNISPSPHDFFGGMEGKIYGYIYLFIWFLGSSKDRTSIYTTVVVGSSTLVFLLDFVYCLINVAIFC